MVGVHCMRHVAIHTRHAPNNRPRSWRRAIVLHALICGLTLSAARGAEANLPEGTSPSAGTASAEPGQPKFSPASRNYWLWQPVQRPSIPSAAQAATPARHPIDALLLASQSTDARTMRSEVDRRTLIRRATFDLHGLPPTPQEVQDFIADTSPGAFERVVDRLLASPRYGEHWARHWLDLVRYAESDGFKSDDLRPNAWRYRDYVICSFNEDKPYDRFISEQLAGDELAPDDLDARVATGFLRLGPYEENARDVLDQRGNLLNDITDVTGQVFLGLTFACARCHDHKYDPILQADYFRLQAFFAGLSQEADQPLATAQAQAEHSQRVRQWEEATREARAQLAEIEAPYRAQLRAEKRSVFPDYVQTMLDTPAERRSPLERQMADLAERQLSLSAEQVMNKMKPEDRERAKELTQAIAHSGVARPSPLPKGLTARDSGLIAPETRIPNQSTDIPPGYPSILDPRPASIAPPHAASSGRRLALARWMARADNPITARVMVNRVFQQHFGRGIVATSEDFGRQGARPSDAQLLDFLASEFAAGGFHLKPLHRLLMTSAAYRQASQDTIEESDMASRSPGGGPWWHVSKRRLTAEQLRDAMLAVSGELNLEMGGPSIRGELPPGMSVAYAWEPDPDVARRNRRSIYMLSRRNLADPLVDAFDLPDSHESCSRRQETTTAPQALTLLNGRWTLDRARALAGRVLRMSEGDRGRVVEAAYQATLQRMPEPDQRAAAEDFLREQSALLAQRLAEPVEKAVPLALPADTNDHSADNPPTARAWQSALVDFCHVLLNSNEFLYLD